MRPVPPPGPLIKAAFAFIFAVVNFCLFVTAAVAWSHHKDLCIKEQAEMWSFDFLEDTIPLVFCGVVRWFTCALLVAVSLIGFVIAGGYFCTAILKPRDHRRGTCTAMFTFLFLLLLAIIVGWTPPGSFNTMTALPPLRPSYWDPATMSYYDVLHHDRHHHFRPHHVKPHHDQVHYDKLGKRAEDPTLSPKLSEAPPHVIDHEDGVKWANAMRKKKSEEKFRDWEAFDSHRHIGGVHGVTGAFLLDTHHTNFGSTKAAAILAHLTLFIGVLLAIVDCLLPDTKPENGPGGGNGKRESVSSEM